MIRIVIMNSDNEIMILIHRRYSVNECSVNECSVDECSVDECSVDECSVDECSVDECSVTGSESTDRTLKYEKYG